MGLFISLALLVFGLFVPLTVAATGDLEGRIFDWTPLSSIQLVWLGFKALAYTVGFHWAIQAMMHTVIRERRLRSHLKGLVFVIAIVVVHHLIELTQILIVQELQPIAIECLHAMLKLTVLAAVNASVDGINDWLLHTVRSHHRFLRSCKPVAKWQAIAKGFTRWGEGKEAQDDAYSVTRPDQLNSAILVLTEMCGYMSFIVKMVALALVLIDFLGIEYAIISPYPWPHMCVLHTAALCACPMILPPRTACIRTSFLSD